MKPGNAALDRGTQGAGGAQATASAQSTIPPVVVHHTALTFDLTRKARASCKALLGEDGKLAVMRLHTRKGEYIIAPAEQETLMVVQKAHSALLVPLVQAADLEQAAAAAAAAASGRAAESKGAKR